MNSTESAPHSSLTVPLEHSPRQHLSRVGVLDALLIGIVAALAFLLASFPARNSDLWLHLASGRILSQGDYRFGTEPFSHTTGAEFWVNHSWAYDLAIYALDSVGGSTALVVVKAFLAALLAAALLAAGWARRGLWTPAVCTVVTLVAASPGLKIQPLLASLLFLSLTVLILEHWARSAARGLRSLWALPVLFALWANMDSWFLLGPLIVALYLVGLIVREGRFSPPVVSLSLALVVGILACLLNPFHVRIFELPPEMRSIFSPGVLQDDAAFALGISVFSSEYWQSGLPTSPAGISALVLALLGLLSFALNRSPFPWGRALTWGALFLLALLKARTIPLFAVVGGPIMALNFQEVATRRDLQLGLPPAEDTAPLKLLSAFAGLLLLVVAWPGWLQAGPHEPRSWTVEPEPSLRRAAEEIRTWRREGRLDRDSLCFNFSPDIAAYFAWFCPEEKGFLDGRLTPFSNRTLNDYLSVRRDLAASSEEGEASVRSRDVLREYKVDHVVLYDPDPDRLTPALKRLFARPAEWPLLYSDGRTAIFGWRDPEATGPDRFGSLVSEFERRAYHPTEADRAPDAWPGRHPDPGQWYDPFVKRRPRRSLDRDEAGVRLIHFDTLAAGAEGRHLLAWRGASTASIVGAAAPSSDAVGGLFDLTLRLRLSGAITPRPQAGQKTAPSIFDVMGVDLSKRYAAGQSDAPAGLLFIAIRAARRALRDNPDDATAYFVLGEAYTRLLHRTSERVWSQYFPVMGRLRRVQASAAFNQALELKPDMIQAHLSLVRLYSELGYLDLWLKHARLVVEYTRSAGPHPDETRNQFEERLKDLEESLTIEPLAKEVAHLLDVYTTNSANLKVSDRAANALRQGLAGKALEVLLAADVAAFGGEGVLLEMRLLLDTGRVREVRDWLDPSYRDESQLGRQAYDDLHLQMLAATGDYLAVDELLAEAASAPTPLGGMSRAGMPAATVMGLSVADMVLHAESSDGVFDMGLRTAHSWFDFLLRLQFATMQAAQRADLFALRGLLALEWGEAERARTSLSDAISIRGGSGDARGVPFSARPMAEGYLRALEGAR